MEDEQFEEQPKSLKMPRTGFNNNGSSTVVHNKIDDSDMNSHEEEEEEDVLPVQLA